MSLVRLTNVQLAFGAEPVLDGANLAIEAGECVALIGRNGAGKSSLMRLLSGEIQPDGGQLVRQQGLRTALLDQSVPTGNDERSIASMVATGLVEGGQQVADYLALVADDTPDTDQLQQHLDALDACDGWRGEQKVQAILNRLGLPGDSQFGSLSGGMKRRVMLARALVGEPDLLLLDEPTNHLDIEAVEQLEETVRGFAGSVLLITHDRAFLRRLATRILDLDLGQLTSWPGNYDTYLRGKAASLEAQDRANAQFDKKLADEERWVRQGIKARRTRNEGRVRALEAMRRERGKRRNAVGTAKAKLQEGERSGTKVVECKDLNFSLPDGRKLVTDLDLLIQRGDKIGLIGPNGVGKTTLIKMLLGQLEPTSGSIDLGTNLNVAWFDQHREQLDPEQTAQQNVAEGSDHVVIDGESRHILSYLQDFLFAPARARAPIRRLSGGERNRLLLAKLFSKPSNLLVMDEPTNDLDVETLELLETLLVNYKGTLLLVSHDRDFLDNTITSTLVFEGGGRVAEYVGGYQDWLRQRPAPQPKKTSAKKAAVQKNETAPAPPKKAKKKLSYKEQRELTELPGKIEKLEAEVEALQNTLADPELYKKDPKAYQQATDDMQRHGEAIALTMQRWEALEESQS